MTSTKQLTRFTWERALIGEHGPNNAVAIAVGLVLATHTRDLSAFPSIELLARESRYSERAVWGALADLVALGWISKTTVRADRGGKGWKRNVYTLTLANRVASDARPSVIGIASSAIPQPRAEPCGPAGQGDGLADGLAPDDMKVTHQVRTNSVLNEVNTSKNTSGARCARDSLQLADKPNGEQPNVDNTGFQYMTWTEVRQLGDSLGIKTTASESAPRYRKRVMEAAEKAVEASVH